MCEPRDHSDVVPNARIFHAPRVRQLRTRAFRRCPTSGRSKRERFGIALRRGSPKRSVLRAPGVGDVQNEAFRERPVRGKYRSQIFAIGCGTGLVAAGAELARARDGPPSPRPPRRSPAVVRQGQRMARQDLPRSAARNRADLLALARLDGVRGTSPGGGESPRRVESVIHVCGNSFWQESIEMAPQGQIVRRP